jgi:hypothetical protein
MTRTLTSLQSYFHNLASILGTTSSWQRLLRSQKGAMGYLSRIPIALFGKSGRTWMLGNIAFYRTVRRVYRTQGSKGLALFMKVSHVCIVKYTAGERIVNGFGQLGHHVRLAGGLPQWLPLAYRKAIRRCDHRTVKYMLTLTSLYRVLDFKGKPKLSTIYEPGTEFNVIPYVNFVGTFFSWLVARVGTLPELGEAKLFHIPKSGPGVHAKPVVVGKIANKKWRTLLKSLKLPKLGTPSRVKAIYKAQRQSNLFYFLGSNTSAAVLQSMSWFSPAFAELRGVLKEYCRLTNSRVYTQLESVGTQAGPISFWRPLVPTFLGKLGVKEEPGKVRVFAMVDWWTQMTLRPLHDLVFKILRKIRQDGTHNQGKAVELAQRYLAQNGVARCFDLSAATDRLPVLLQSFLVNHLLPGTGQLWTHLLVGRLYEVTPSVRKLGMRIPKSLAYAVGQPMGALSSWALLALTHHFIVQFAAFRAGFLKWFEAYVILGDDIVMFDNHVAEEYLLIMKDLGVDINLVKSVQSKDSFEFAKRYFTKGVDVSPLSFKELDVAGASLDALLQLVQRFQGGGLRLASILRLQGFGYRVLGNMNQLFSKMSRRLRFLLIWLTFPGHSRWSYDTTLNWIRGTSVGRSANSIDVESLRGILITLATAWNPNRFHGDANPFLQSQSRDFFVNRPGGTDVLYPTNLWNEEYPGMGGTDAWRVSIVADIVRGLMWPIERNYFGSIRDGNDQWNKIDFVGLIDGDLLMLEDLLNQMLDHRIIDSLLPSSIDVSVYKSEKPRLRAGRWLTYWVRLRKSLRKTC